MIFMFAVTITALINLIIKNILTKDYLLAFMAVMLLLVAVILAVQAFSKMRSMHNKLNTQTAEAK